MDSNGGIDDITKDVLADYLETKSLRQRISTEHSSDISTDNNIYIDDIIRDVLMDYSENKSRDGKLTYQGSKDILKDIFLIEFYEKKTKDIEIIKEYQVHNWDEYFLLYTFDDITTIYNGGQQMKISNIPLVTDIPKHLEEQFPNIYKALLLCKGKLYVYGFNFMYFISDPYDDGEYFGGDLNLCFCSCTVEEANSLLLQCISLFDAKMKYRINEEGIIFFTKESSIFFSFNICTDKYQLLRSIGPAPEQHIWNPIDGYITTYSGGLCMAMSAYPFDINADMTDWSTYFNNGIKSLFYGLDKDSDLKEDIINNINRSVFSNTELRYSKVNKKRFVLDEEKDVISRSMKLFVEIPKLYIHPKDCYKESYDTCLVGISNDRYVALSGIRKKFKLDIYVFRILCGHWLNAEVNTAKSRLLSLKLDQVD